MKVEIRFCKPEDAERYGRAYNSPVNETIVTFDGVTRVTHDTIFTTLTFDRLPDYLQLFNGQLDGVEARAQ